MNHTRLIILSILIQTINCQPTEAQRWGYGILASFGVSLIGFLVSGVIIGVKSKVDKSQTNKLMKILIGFAIGALLGDAFIHLIPHSFGTHEEEEEQTDDDHENTSDEHSEDASKEYLTSLCLICGVFAFFMLEKMMIILEHSVTSKVIPVLDEQPQQQDTEQLRGSTESDNSPQLKDKINKIQNDHYQAILQLPISQQIFSIDSWKHKPTLGYLNLLSDFLHNIMDGLALGVLFASSSEDDFKSVVATLIAIIIHELAQEIGDTSILLENKFTYAQALVANGFINLSALIGAFIGLGVASMENDTYVLAFVAGNFIYISCVDMLPEILKEVDILQSLLQSLGICCGLAIMYGIAVFEHELE